MRTLVREWELRADMCIQDSGTLKMSPLGSFNVCGLVVGGGHKSGTRSVYLQVSHKAALSQVFPCYTGGDVGMPSLV